MSKTKTQWNLSDLGNITRSIQEILRPLINDVLTLEKTDANNKKKKGKSVRGETLVNVVEKATQMFVNKAQEISKEYPKISQEMNDAISLVIKAGHELSTSATNFVADSSISANREKMVQAARNLLSSVTRVLLIADMVDVYLLLNVLNTLKVNLEDIENVKTEEQLQQSLKLFDKNAEQLLQQSGTRQHEILNEKLRDNLASARAILKKERPILITATQTYIQHPDLPAAKENRDFVIKQMCQALQTIHNVSNGENEPETEKNNFDVITDLNVLNEFLEKKTNGDASIDNKSLERQLETILGELGEISNSDCISGDKRDGIYKACNDLRDTLANVLSEFERNLNNVDSVNSFKKKVNNLKRQLGKAVNQDSLLETTTHLENLIKAAEEGNLEKTEKYAEIFANHAKKIVEVANVMSKMSNNEEGSIMACQVADQIKILYPQVINAARVLAAQPQSLNAQKNIKAFKEFYENQLKLLIAAIDEITTINEFLAVSDNQILDDIQKCAEALKNGDIETFEKLIENIHQRIERLTNFVSDEMDNYEPCLYTKRVLEAVRVLKDEILPEFTQKIDGLSENYKKNPDLFNEDDFIDASNILYNAMREIRTAVLMVTPNDELDEDEVEIQKTVILETDQSHMSNYEVDEYPEVSGIDNTRELMSKLPEAEKKKIQEQVKSFEEEKHKFDQEVAKWDESTYDLVVLAKHMSRILKQMTDFTKGQGPLKTTMNLIAAAQAISVSGNKFEKLTLDIVNECTDKTFSNELVGYVENINLYCQQLKITSQVKQVVQINAGALVVSSLDSVTSLIATAKNLMEVVVKILKTSHLVLLKSKSNIKWQRKLPEKKPLVIISNISNAEDIKIIRRDSVKKQRVDTVLSEFHSNSELV